VLAVAVLLTALILRLWDLPLLPAGLTNTEISNVVLASNAQQGDIRVLYDLNAGGQEGLYPLLAALTTFAIGDGVLGYRLLSLWVGLLTLAVTYALGARLFGRTAGIAAMALLAATMLPVLLSRVVLVESLLPLLVTVVMLTLVRALPVYPSLRTQRTNTSAFAALGIVLGLSLYLHPVGLLLTLASMAFIAYFIVLERSLSRQRLSYIGFSILMLIIIAMPYLISTINLPELAASQRIFGDYGGLTSALLNTLGALGLQGDQNAALNIPGRPLFDPITLLFLLLGLAYALRFARRPAYALPLISGLVLAPAVVLADNPPNFQAMATLLPIFALLFGLGVRTLMRFMDDYAARRLAWSGLLLLLLFNIAWTLEDLFIAWPQRDDVRSAYNADLAELAHHLDVTGGHLDSVICFPDWQQARQTPTLEPTELMLLMMNRAQPRLRTVDCRNGLLFTNGGGNEQIIITEPGTLQAMHPHIRAWIERGMFIDKSRLPEQRVVLLSLERSLADALGVYTTTSLANYAFDAVTASVPVLPPIRFGGNVTWLGGQRLSDGPYQAGDTLEVANYWRVEGITPPDLQLFTHILRDPVSIAAQRDMISVDPRQLQGRDVFVQITRVPIPETSSTGEYIVSVGAYQESTGERLTVFDRQQVARGDRLFLYAVDIINPAEANDAQDASANAETDATTATED
jgi:hypothetical protein